MVATKSQDPMVVFETYYADILFLLLSGEVQSDLLDSISSFDYVDDDIGSTNPKELVFAASDLPGFGVKLYYVEKTASKSEPIKSTPKLKFGTDVMS
jgi:hypothetical protein